jgi:hypothetical protein
MLPVMNRADNSMLVLMLMLNSYCDVAAAQRDLASVSQCFVTMLILITALQIQYNQHYMLLL